MINLKLSSDRLILREIRSGDIFGYYQILSDSDTMAQFGGPTLASDLDRKDIVDRMKFDKENKKAYFWTILLKEEKEFIGFIRLYSYSSEYFSLSFSAMGSHINDPDFLAFIDKSGWEIDYALLTQYRNRGIMSEAVDLVLKFCKENNLNPIYAKVNSLKNANSVSVLRKNNFSTLMPLVADFDKIKGKSIETLIKEKEIGMMFQWRINKIPQ